MGVSIGSMFSCTIHSYIEVNLILYVNHKVPNWRNGRQEVKMSELVLFSGNKYVAGCRKLGMFSLVS